MEDCKTWRLNGGIPALIRCQALISLSTLPRVVHTPRSASRYPAVAMPPVGESQPAVAAALKSVPKLHPVESLYWT